MENLKEIRWKQRFTNLDKAFTLYNEGVSSVATLNRLEKEGLIQRFEYTFELSWKTLKDYLESKGIDVAYPRDVLKEAFANELIIDGETWMTMLDNRDLTSELYEDRCLNDVFLGVVNEKFEAIKALHNKLKMIG